MPYRATFFFRNTGAAGWSETYYSTLSDPTLLMARAKLLKDVRRGLLSHECFLSHIRVSNDDPQRDSNLEGFSSVDSRGLFPVLGDPYGNADPAFVAALVQIKATQYITGRVFLRGIPDSEDQGGGALIGSAQWQAAFADYRAELLANAWALRTLSTSPAPAIVATLVQPGGQQIVAGTTLLPHGWTDGQLVNFTGGIGSAGARGRHRVFATGNLAFSFRTNKLVTTYAGGMKGRAVIFRVDAITDVDYLRAVSHKVGRPFGAPRGRRRTLV